MLTEPFLMLETTHGPQAATLPQALACLCDASVIGFDGLAAHQRHGWYLFLCQIAALALVRSGETDAVADDAAWRALADSDAWGRRLADLTPGCADTAWSLVAKDLTRPAFLQPPIGGGTLDGYRIAGQTPDEIDVLITAKGHDIKAARAAVPEPRHWLFALVTLQTMQGYSGRGNFGIARMNGGFASRPLVMVTPSRDLPARFRRGVQAALAARRTALDTDGYYYRDDGLALLWLKTWDTETSLPLADLDPLFVEICRRVRLVPDARGRITAWGKPSEVARVAVPKEAKGNLGDAWTPIDAKESAALTMGSAGFDYRRVRRLLNRAEFSRPAAMDMEELDPDGDAWLHAAVLVRGQGKTEGLHERWLRLPHEMKPILSDPTKAEMLAALSGGMIAHADDAKKALRLGLLKFLQGGGEKTDFEDNRPQPWLDALEQRIDGIFFHHLFARVRTDDDPATETAWRNALATTARDLFGTAISRLSPPDCRRERALAVASMTFAGLLRKAELTGAATAPDAPPDKTREDDGP
jgi:CRISPR system Cascade subunit CasA